VAHDTNGLDSIVTKRFEQLNHIIGNAIKQLQELQSCIPPVGIDTQQDKPLPPPVELNWKDSDIVCCVSDAPCPTHKPVVTHDYGREPTPDHVKRIEAALARLAEGAPVMSPTTREFVSQLDPRFIMCECGKKFWGTPENTAQANWLAHSERTGCGSYVKAEPRGDTP